MSANKFTIEDNEDKRFSEEDVKVKFRHNEHISRVWTMSFDELVQLQTSIATFIAGERSS